MKALKKNAKVKSKAKPNTKVKTKLKSKATSKVKAKLSAKARTKLKAKVGVKSKVKPKTKAKAKTKTKAKTKVVKAKKLVKTKSKITSKLKSPIKAKRIVAKKKVKVSSTKSKPKKLSPSRPKAQKAKSKSKAVAKSAPSQSKAANKPKNKFTPEQKEKLLHLLELIISLRRGNREGLGSYEKIDRILDEYNQHYQDVLAKFDAIIEYGMKKDPAFLPKNAFVPTAHKSEYEIKLYALLENIWEGNIDYENAFDQMNSIYVSSLTERNHNHLENESEYE